MMQITIFDVFWLMLASAATSGIITILSALVTGYLVFRTKKENHETLFPPKRKEGKRGPIVIDEFSGEVEKNEDEERGLPDVIKRMNERMGAELAMSGLKEKNNG